MFADHHQFSLLDKTLHQFGYYSIPWFFMIFFILDGHSNLYTIINKNRFDKAEPVIAIGHGYLIDQVGGQSDRNGKNEGAMGDPVFEGLGIAPGFIHMMGEKVAGLFGMEIYILGGDGLGAGLARLVQCKILVILPDEHGKG